MKKAAASLVLTAAVVIVGGAQQALVPRRLPINVLPTTFGFDDPNPPAYAPTITVDVPAQLQIAAYGAAGRVWLAPPSWTGEASVSADGNTTVHLHPRLERGSNGASISVRIDPACMVCQLGDAARFFPDAITEWNRRYNANGSMPLKAPASSPLVTRVNPQLVRFAEPVVNGWRVQGVAFYAPDHDGLFEEMDVSFPRSDDARSDFLMTYFAAHIPR